MADETKVMYVKRRAR